MTKTNVLVATLLLVVLMLAGCGGGQAATTTPEATPGDAQSLLNTAQSALDAGNLDTAISDFQAAVQSNPSLDAYFGLGNAYARQNRLAEARDAYEAALKINPNHASTLSNLGVVYYQLGQLADAKDTFNKALSLNPNDAATHYLLGAAELQMDDLNAADTSFQKALELQPDLPEAHFGMGMLRRMQGRTDEAIQQFQAFLAGPPAQDPRARSEAERILNELQAGQ